ncbi:MAG: RagB/SusD family nutrient uptake outer membrane protein [Proteobacteria bacterium]|nr:RagB/SusD family nutrient uptake outer membrane protein [Pseudomonadota bacterium]
MKFNNLLFKICLVGFISFTTFSCDDDFLETQALSEVSSEAVFNSPELADAAVRDLYQGTWAGPLSSTITTDAFTDHAFHTYADYGAPPMVDGSLNPEFNFGQLAYAVSPINYIDWESLYPFIRGSNLAINALTANEAGLSESEVNKLLGESYFMRAYFYSQLVRNYGGVVLTLDPLVLDSEPLDRSSFEDSIKQIVSDLDMAINLLGDSNAGNKARATKLAALALKSRILTHAASDLFNPSKNSVVSTLSSFQNKELVSYTTDATNARWEAAKAASKAFLDVATGYNLDLTTPASIEDAKQNYLDLSLQGELNPDFLWGRIFKEFGYDSRTYKTGRPEDYGWYDPGFFALLQGPNGYNQWAVNSVPYDQFNEIQTGEYTFNDGTVKFGVDTNKGQNPGSSSLTHYWYNKFTDPDTPTGYLSDNQFISAPYLRHTEVLLNYVEANLNLGNEQEAKSWLNKLRYRNGLPAVTESGAALVELYKRERDKELVNEDSRFFDMRRWLEGPYSLNKQAQRVEVKGVQKPGSTMTPSTYRKSSSDFDYTYEPKDIIRETRVWRDKKYFSPIPQTEINKAPNLIQNPGYN